MKRGFSLIELLIVVLIMGVIYTLAVTKFPDALPDEKPLTLENLKDFLRDIPYDEEISLVCLTGCRDCFVVRDGVRAHEFDDRFGGLFRYAPQRHLYTLERGFVKMEPEFYFVSEHEEREVCFSYRLDARGGGEEVFVEYNGFVYDMSGTLKTPRYNTLEEAREAREGFAREVLQ